MNAVYNIVFLFVVTLIFFSINIATFAERKTAELANSTMSTYVGEITGNSTLLSWSQNYPEYDTTVTEGLNFLMAFFVGLTLISSFFDYTDVKSYVMSFFAGVVMSSIYLYFVNYIVASMITYAGDISIMGETFAFTSPPEWFLDNMGLILFSNIAVNLLSVFLRRRDT